jgi:hypothetical protein
MGHQMAQDWAEQRARKALQQYRHGSQISAGCGEIYEAVAEAIREAYKTGEAKGIAAMKK